MARMNRPETRYAWNGDVSLAYQVVGDGPTDLLYLQGYCSNVDVNWESRPLAHFLRGLARHARVIVTDRRGWGCSERFTPGYIPDVDVLTDDIQVVMSAVGSEQASILATYESAIVASLFAAVPGANDVVDPCGSAGHLSADGRHALDAVAGASGRSRSSLSARHGARPSGGTLRRARKANGSAATPEHP